MSRPRGIFRHAAAAACVLTLGCWVRSYFACDQLEVGYWVTYRPSGHREVVWAGIESYGGRFSLLIGDGDAFRFPIAGGTKRYASDFRCFFRSCPDAPRWA